MKTRGSVRCAHVRSLISAGIKRVENSMSLQGKALLESTLVSVMRGSN